MVPESLNSPDVHALGMRAKNIRQKEASTNFRSSYRHFRGKKKRRKEKTCERCMLACSSVELPAPVNICMDPAGEVIYGRGGIGLEGFPEQPFLPDMHARLDLGAHVTLGLQQ